MSYLALFVGSYLAFSNLAQQNLTVPGGLSSSPSRLVDLSSVVPAYEWNAYKTQYGKVYESSDIETMRKIIYANNKQRVDQFNKRHGSSLEQTDEFYDAQLNAQKPDKDDELHFSIALNHLADLSDIELLSMNGFRVPKAGSADAASNEADDDTSETNATDGSTRPAHLRNSRSAQLFLDKISNTTISGSNSPFANAKLGSDSLPESVDWRTVEGRVSKVKNQGQCGSCWAFASTGALEGQEKVRPSYAKQRLQHNNNDKRRSVMRRLPRGQKNATAPSALVELSEQNLVDCVKKDYGCNGGFMKDAFDFVQQENGIDDENSYPYEAMTRECRFKRDKVAFTDAGGALLPEGDEQKLKEIVAKFGPVAVAIDASSLWFQFYHHGVYHSFWCHKKMDQLDHGVLVVGYGTDPKKGDYWLVKNSWGEVWGEKGYIRMARNRRNMCGIATAATIPTF